MQKKGQTKHSTSAIVFTNGVPNFWGGLPKRHVLLKAL